MGVFTISLSPIVRTLSESLLTVTPPLPETKYYHWKSIRTLRVKFYIYLIFLDIYILTDPIL